jgi:hypothetical protein
MDEKRQGESLWKNKHGCARHLNIAYNRAFAEKNGAWGLWSRSPQGGGKA